MNDAIFLSKHIDFLEVTKKKFGNLLLLDTKFNIRFLSDSVLTCFRSKTEQDMLGLNFIWDLPRPTEIIAEKYRLFTEIIKFNKPRSYIAINSNELYNYRKVVICATPISNPETNNIIGIELTGNVTNQNWFLSQKERSLYNKNNQFNSLSNYEVAIIYFKCLKKTDIQVSQLLSNYYQKEITTKMISYEISENIYYKLEVVNIKQLRAKADLLQIQHMNIDEILPRDDIIVF